MGVYLNVAVWFWMEKEGKGMKKLLMLGILFGMCNLDCHAQELPTRRISFLGARQNRKKRQKPRHEATVQQSSAQPGQLQTQLPVQQTPSNQVQGSALHLACINDNEQRVWQLLQAGRARDEVVEQYLTDKLCTYAAHGNAERVRYYLKQGLLSGCRNAQGNTPLHNACVHGQQDVVRVLL